MVIRGEEDRLDQPLDPDLLLPDCFQGLLVLDRAQGIEPSLERVTDLEDPDFGLPMYYTVHLQTEAGRPSACIIPGCCASWGGSCPRWRRSGKTDGAPASWSISGRS